MGIILVLVMIVVMLMPYIIGVILSAIIICLIRTKSISTIFKIIIIIIILLCIFIILITIINQKPNDLYREMKRINDNESLIGLSKEQVVELLGEPSKIYKDSDIGKEVYKYNAGHIFVEITFWGKTHWYVLSINFDETDKVESTLMKESLELVI